MAKQNKKRIGGRGHFFESRNRELVLKKLENPKLSFKDLAKLFEINKRTAYDIYRRDKDKYSVGV